MGSNNRNLETKSLQELQELASNDIAIIEMVSNDETLKSVQLEVETAQENNKMLAGENIDMAEKIPSLKTELQRLNQSIQFTNQQLQVLIANHDSLKIGDTGGKLEDLTDQLKINASETDEKSEKIAEEFLNGTISLEAFLQTYKDARKDAHLARIKADKFAEIVEKERIARQQRSAMMSSVGNLNRNAQTWHHPAAATASSMHTAPPSFNPYLAGQNGTPYGAMGGASNPYANNPYNPTPVYPY